MHKSGVGLRREAVGICAQLAVRRAAGGAVSGAGSAVRLSRRKTGWLNGGGSYVRAWRVRWDGDCPPSPAHIGPAADIGAMRLAGFLRFCAVPASRNSSLAPLGPRRRSRSSARPQILVQDRDVDARGRCAGLPAAQGEGSKAEMSDPQITERAPLAWGGIGSGRRAFPLHMEELR